jgi:uncharacterized cupredoxin-like copper-binding protein
MIARPAASGHRLAVAALLAPALAVALHTPRAAADDIPGHHHGHGGTDTSFGRPGVAAQADRIVRVEATDMKFSLPSLEIRTGQTIRFVVANKGEAEHDFTIGDAATQEAHRAEMAGMMAQGSMDHGHGAGATHHDDANAVFVKPGETKELIWTFSRPGTFEFACNVPGHSEAGMRGAISVAGAPAK